MTHNNGVNVADPLAQETLLKEMAKKTSGDLEAFLNQLYNDSSLGLYHMNEHIRRRVPQIVEEKKGLINLEKDLEITISDTKDSDTLVKSLPTISSFKNIGDLLKSTLDIVEAAKIKK
ncbi:23231_t:CDS:2 [Dentiscutata erythropus]|uniref:23231_t:CDS:1 n=1 Tax=Dentiscutata erythropus TaxID=1348616 RepID=A0A9N9BEP8_9GLOM|nr:23231_t:CDS:2 [Dentiscutata erythropus]